MARYLSPTSPPRRLKRRPKVGPNGIHSPSNAGPSLPSPLPTSSRPNRNHPQAQARLGPTAKPPTACKPARPRTTYGLLHAPHCLACDSPCSTQQPYQQLHLALARLHQPPPTCMYSVHAPGQLNAPCSCLTPCTCCFFPMHASSSLQSYLHLCCLVMLFSLAVHARLVTRRPDHCMLLHSRQAHPMLLFRPLMLLVRA